MESEYIYILLLLTWCVKSVIAVLSSDFEICYIGGRGRVFNFFFRGAGKTGSKGARERGSESEGARVERAGITHTESVRWIAKIACKWKWFGFRGMGRRGD
jgi:hypothetical protein